MYISLINLIKFKTIKPECPNMLNTCNIKIDLMYDKLSMCYLLQDTKF